MGKSGWVKSATLLVGLGLTGAGGWWMYQGKGTTQYQSERLERGDITAVISSTGSCNAVVSVQVGSQVSGNIKELYADFNTKVTKGQLVALIDPETFQAKVKQAQANLMSAQAAKANALAAGIKAEADLGSAKSNLTTAEANAEKSEVALKDAQSKLARQKTLFEKKLVAKEEVETYQATLDSAAAAVQSSNSQVEAARHAIESAKAQLEVIKAQAMSADAQIAQSQAALDQSSIDLKHTEIKAPVDGTVVARRMDAGQTVAASFSAPTLFEIAQDLTKMQVDATIDEADIGRVREGQKATFTVDAYPGEPFIGKVVQIRRAPITVQNVVTYDVVIEVGNPDLKLFPGMTANIRIIVDRKENALKLPSAALRVKIGDAAATAGAARAGGGGGGGGNGGARPGGGGAAGGGRGKGGKPQGEATVWVPSAAGAPKPVKVQLGLSDGAFTEIVGGELKEGDAVVVAVIQPKGSAAAPPPASPFSSSRSRF